MPAFGQMQQPSTDPRVDILFNFHHRSFELAPQRVPDPISVIGHIALKHLLRNLSGLPITRYRSTSSLTLSLLGILLFVGAITFLFPLTLCIFATCIIAAASIASLATFITDLLLFPKKIARIAEKYAAERPKITLVSDVGAAQFFGCSFRRGDPVFCTVSVEAEDTNVRKFRARPNQSRFDEIVAGKTGATDAPSLSEVEADVGLGSLGHIREDAPVAFYGASPGSIDTKTAEGLKGVDGSPELQVDLNISQDLLTPGRQTPTRQDVNLLSTKENLYWSSLSDSNDPTLGKTGTTAGTRMP